jgi:phosphatidylserine/phosphatidylglycerophosphate/cardiolipin synthase-like enzyme
VIKKIALLKTEVVTNQEYLPALLKLLSGTKKSIDILSFSFAIGSAAGKLATNSAPFEIAEKIIAMKNKLGRKIKIRLYIEGKRDTSERNRVTARYLKDAGVEVVYGSTHAKGFCIDGKKVLFGSTNLTQQSILKNNEANVLLESAAYAKEFTRYFNYLWDGGKHGGITLTESFYADGDFLPALLDLIDQAQKEIQFSIYFFNHRDIEKALIRAHERGLVVMGFIHQHASFALPYIWANRSTVKRMRKAGLKNLFFSVPTTFSHAKYIVVDRTEVMIGTGNWLVEDVTTHPQLYLHLSGKVVAKKFIQHFKFEILEQSTQD